MSLPKISYDHLNAMVKEEEEEEEVVRSSSAPTMFLKTTDFEKGEAGEAKEETPSDQEKRVVASVPPAANTDRPPTPWTSIILDIMASAAAAVQEEAAKMETDGEKNDVGKKVSDDGDDNDTLVIDIKEDEGEEEEEEAMDGAVLWEVEAKKPSTSVPLLDYLSGFMNCSLKELQVLFNNIEARRRMLAHLRTCQLRTSHLRPDERNLILHAHDLSAQNANLAYACGGYLEITVRQYYYVKHGRRLKHPYLPCMIEFGGSQHASYYPLEVISVEVSIPTYHTPSIICCTKKTITTTPPQAGCHHCCSCQMASQ